MKTPTVLLIDDTVADLRVLLDMLSIKNWRVIVSFDGADGLKKASLKKPDLILLDVRMPKMDGFATCLRLKADPRTERIPVIFLTAAEDKTDRLQGLTIGAVDYIIKPFASEEEVLARMALHLKLNQGLGQQTAADTPIDDPGNYPPLVSAATRYLVDHLTNPPSPEALAMQLGSNEKRLNELFQEAFSMPIYTWLREYRLSVAQQLLSQTDTPIAAIAQHCGYSSGANFSTAFKERFGSTPRQFRKALADKPRLSCDTTNRD